MASAKDEGTRPIEALEELERMTTRAVQQGQPEEQAGEQAEGGDAEIGAAPPGGRIRCVPRLEVEGPASRRTHLRG